jgi:EAL and modified HD-GYP domain-containing signal transduction protein
MSQQASSTSAFPSQINDNPQKTLRYLGCQPILDSRHKTLGHELLFRGGEGNCFTGDPESASRQVIDRTLTMGLSGIVGNGKIFVNCTKEILTNGLVTLLPPERTVMEVLETVEVDSSLVAACSGLKDKGYQIALDDYMPESGI